MLLKTGIILSLVYLCLIKRVNGKIEPFIVGGEYTYIKGYPHAVLLNIQCVTGFICGASILNQNVVLSAGHCLEDCYRGSGGNVVINYGHQEISKMMSTLMNDFKIHDNYNKVSLHNDISILMCKEPIKLSYNVKRVAILINPPKWSFAYVAGWGAINEFREAATMLRHTFQKKQTPNVCGLLGHIPIGSFCAGPVRGRGYPYEGDSGSALIVNLYIQIGIVSYKLDHHSLVVYTNVSHYYGWIANEARKLYCKMNPKK